MVRTRNPREGRAFVSKVPTVTGMGPLEPGILVSVVTFEATQLRGVFKVATLSWLGHGFGLCCAQLLILNPELPNPFRSIHLNPKQPHHPHHKGGVGANPKPNTHHPLPHHREWGKEDKHHGFHPKSS